MQAAITSIYEDRWREEGDALAEQSRLMLWQAKETHDMLCCMVDENLTQQHIAPKTIFEIVAAAVKEAEKMLRESKDVYEFNANFRHSKGLPSLLQKSDCIDQYKRNSWALEEYNKAKDAIEPSGSGLGRGFLQHFLPPHSVANNNTLQTAIATYYQEPSVH